MKNTNEKSRVRAAFNKAVAGIADDMERRGIAAILWDNSTAGFHFIPEVTVVDEKGERDELRVMGLYLYDGSMYLVEEEIAPVRLTEFYTDGVEVPPAVVTLTDDSARRHLGDPEEQKGYTTQASDEEWLNIADCYFEALREQ